MAKRFTLQVYTQEKLVLSEQITSLIVPGEQGYLGVLADHAPLISTLGEGTVTIKNEGEERQARISGGFLEVVNNTATILADSYTEASPTAPGHR
jgi:F-type H+-transporting ATPase subunit epsilon